jgi:hypothetical protein
MNPENITISVLHLFAKSLRAKLYRDRRGLDSFGTALWTQITIWLVNRVSGEKLKFWLYRKSGGLQNDYSKRPIS